MDKIVRINVNFVICENALYLYTKHIFTFYSFKSGELSELKVTIKSLSNKNVRVKGIAFEFALENSRAPSSSSSSSSLVLLLEKSRG